MLNPFRSSVVETFYASKTGFFYRKLTLLGFALTRTAGNDSCSTSTSRAFASESKHGDSAVTAAYPWMASLRVECRVRKGGPGPAMALLFPIRERQRDFSGVLNELSRDRAERAMLEGKDSNWNADQRQVNGQDPDLRAGSRQSQS